MLGHKIMRHRVSSNGAYVRNIDPESGGPHCLWVIKSFLGHQLSLTRFNFTSNLLSPIHALGYLQRGTCFLLSAGVHLSLRPEEVEGLCWAYRDLTLDNYDLNE